MGASQTTARLTACRWCVQGEAASVGAVRRLWHRLLFFCSFSFFPHTTRQLPVRLCVRASSALRKRIAAAFLVFGTTGKPIVRHESERAARRACRALPLDLFFFPFLLSVSSFPTGEPYLARNCALKHADRIAASQLPSWGWEPK